MATTQIRTANGLLSSIVVWILVTGLVAAGQGCATASRGAGGYGKPPVKSVVAPQFATANIVRIAVRIEDLSGAGNAGLRRAAEERVIQALITRGYETGSEAQCDGLLTVTVNSATQQSESVNVGIKADGAGGDKPIYLLASASASRTPRNAQPTAVFASAQLDGGSGGSRSRIRVHRQTCDVGARLTSKLDGGVLWTASHTRTTSTESPSAEALSSCVVRAIEDIVEELPARVAP